MISIGIIAEDSREYYAQSTELLEHGKPTPWIEKHVIPYLDNIWTERTTIAEEIKVFINAGDGTPEFWGWCAAYDFVALCQIFGTMMDLPTGWPHHIMDIQYEMGRCITPLEMHGT